MTARRRLFVLMSAAALAIGASGGLVFAAGLTPTAKTIVTGSITPPTFYVNSIADTNGNLNAGKLEFNDKSVALFKTQVQQSTLCSSWSNALNSQSLAGFTFTLNDNAGSGGTDTLTVTTSPGACAGGFHFGTVDLQSAGYVTGGNATFTNSTISLTQTATTTTVTLTLGTPGGAGTLVKVTIASAAVYTPDATITNTSAVSIGLNTSTTTTTVQF